MRINFRLYYPLTRMVMALFLFCSTSAYLFGVAGCIQEEWLDFNAYTHIHYSTVFNKRFRFAISNALYDKLPIWTPASGTHPPITPGAAMKLASQHVKSINVDDRFEWKFDRLELKPIGGGDDKWIYIVVFKYFPKDVVATTGYPQSIEYIVTLDGKLIEPVEVAGD